MIASTFSFWHRYLPIFTFLRSMSKTDRDRFRRWIPDFHERIQVLHHAAIYNKEKVAFLVGHGSGNLVFGLIIKIPGDLLKEYHQVLGFMYDAGLCKFYWWRAYVVCVMAEFS